MRRMKFAVCFTIVSFLMASLAHAATLSTVAGNGSMQYCGDGGAATEACLATPFDVTFDDSGNYYIADHSNDRIRKVDANGIITTVAGGGSSLESGINALDASVRRASGQAFIRLEGKGYLYISDRDNGRAIVLDIEAGRIYNILTNVPGGTGGIRPVVVNGVLYVYITTGDARLIAVTMSDPLTPGTATDILTGKALSHMVTYVSSGKTYLVMNEYWGGLVSRMDISDPLAPTGYTVIAGGGSDTADTVPATSAFLVEPYGMVRDGAGNLYISEHSYWTRSSGNRIRKITPEGLMTTVAGVSGVYGFLNDGGPATEATFYCPTGLTMDPSGNLYVGDDWNHRIRRITLGCAAPPSGMAAWWPGDGGAYDLAGTNQGVMSPGAAFESGLAGQAFSLDGANGLVRIADHPSLDTPDGLTIDAWIYPRSFGGPRVIASKWDDPTGQWSWIFKLHNDGSGRLRIEISRGGDHDALGDLGGTAILPLNTWSHVAATYDRQTSRLRLYLNGSVDAEGAAQFPGVAINSSATDLLIGAVNGQTTAPSEFFDGRIDEVELFNRALSAEELSAIYLAGSAGKCKPANLQPVANAGPDQTAPYDIDLQGAAVTLDGSGSSDPDGNPLTYTWTWTGGSATGATPTIVLPVGTTVVTLTVSDGRGGTATDTVQLSVVYSFGGFLPPVSLAKSFRLGSIIPVKFQLTDAHGLFVALATAHITMVRISANEPVGDVVEGTSNVPDAGNTFRYAVTDQQYIYNLSTGTLSMGTWRIIVSLNDGNTFTADINLK